jgi:hypothetical protein
MIILEKVATVFFVDENHSVHFEKKGQASEMLPQILQET